jgi:MoxR-like ATPase
VTEEVQDLEAAGQPAVELTAELADVGRRAMGLLDEVERAVVGKRAALELVLLGLLADGHVLIEDYPGLAKTVIARSFAQVLGLEFARIQFTPDLMPADVTGSSVFDQRSGTFDFRPGPVFCNLLLADEINRTPPKTQAALLEAMQERQVTVEGTTRPLPRPFLVIATQNPIEYEGTYPLPEAQLDRFLLRARIGYPDRDDERRILARRAARRSDEVALDRLADAAEVLAMQAALEQVHVAASIEYYIVDLVAATRDDRSVAVGASPRGTLALFKLARAHALLHGRDFVVPDDVKQVAVPALAHRLTLRPELWVQRVDPDEVVRGLLARVPAPAPEERVRPDHAPGPAAGGQPRSG